MRTREKTDNKCRLCEHEAQLINSHILPELVFKPCYDDKHRSRQHILPSFKRSLQQKGYREKLLCNDCELRFSRYERYFSNVWYGPSALRPALVPPPGLALSDLDYTRFKLFHLSILWRAGVSKHEAFESVRLGPHAQRIAELLLKNDPGPPHRYPLGVIALSRGKSGNLLEGYVTSLGAKSVDGHTTYFFVFGGCLWWYEVSSHRQAWFPNALSQDGCLMLLSQPFNHVPVIQDVLALYGKGILEGKVMRPNKSWAELEKLLQ